MKKDQREAGHNIQTQYLGRDRRITYTKEGGRVIANRMREICEGVIIEGQSYLQRFYMEKGFKVYGKKAVEGYNKDSDQMHPCNAF